jgi:predicted ATPase
MIIQKIARNTSFPNQCRSMAFLRVNNWDDYSYKTLFFLTVFDESGVAHNIGNVKIGYSGQEIGWTEEHIPSQFENLGRNFFSLGQEAEYYQNIKSLSFELANYLLDALRDIANDDDLLASVRQEQVFKTSLLRGISLSAIHGQYKRILIGGALLTVFHFLYIRQTSESKAGFELDFHIAPNSKPSTNIHILIGRNGVGKTTLLNNMVSSIVDRQAAIEDVGEFYDISNRNNIFANSDITPAISADYFSSVASVSFSAFDTFIPPLNRADRSQGTCYFYIGLKNIITEGGKRKVKLKDFLELREDFVSSLKTCLSLQNKKERWISAILKLESDMNFAEMGLPRLANIEDLEDVVRPARFLFDKMSSGHAVVLLSITKLIETVEEKTLVLIDEPESHLHPPLLSAFTRALSDLLINRNAVAIIATHSPVVLQEVPKSCVWKLRRTRLVGHADRPESETFAENVGVLTREVFGLEVSKSGFHELLATSVAEGKNYEEILNEYDNQLGFEGKAILRALVTTRDVQEGEHQ